MAFYHPESWRYVRVKGMGLVDALCCPHFDSDTAGVKREEDFRQMVRKHPDVAVAIDNNCAVEVVDDTYRVITSRAAVGAYKLLNRRGELSVKRIEQKEAYEPIALLLQRE
jgi:dipeptidase E